MRKCAEMPFHMGIKVRIYPSRQQKHIIAVNAGSSRAVYNRLVALNNERYRLSKTAEFVPVFRERIEYINSILKNPKHALRASLKNALPFLNVKGLVDSMCIDNAMQNYQAAWARHRKDPHTFGIPAFHRKGYEISYQTNAHYNKGADNINECNVRFLDKNHVTLPIIGRIRIKGSETRIAKLMSRKETRIGAISIRKDSIDRYFASFQIASETPFVDPLPKTGSMVGIDLNIDNFLWDSNNAMVDNPKYRRSEQKNIVTLQRALCRKKERAKLENRSIYTSKNYQKNRRKLAALHAKVAGRANDFRHVISKDYVENQDYIFAEDLKVRNLLKNHKLALAISECGWSDFLSKLEYKAGLYGKVFLKVRPHGTTQTCSNCGHTLKDSEKLGLGDREWICPDCGTYHIRDYNAAQNILARGIAISGI